MLPPQFTDTGAAVHDVECPVCGHNAREYSKLHCTSKCPWLVCTNKDCGTTYSWEQPERYFMDA
jgi:transcription elongation factor Elf1